MSKQYATVVFLQGDEAAEALTLVRMHQTKALFEALTQWDYGEYHDTRTEPPWGTSDRRYEDDGYPDYLVHANTVADYVSLTRILD